MRFAKLLFCSAMILGSYAHADSNSTSIVDQASVPLVAMGDGYDRTKSAKSTLPTKALDSKASHLAEDGYDRTPGSTSGYHKIVNIQIDNTSDLLAEDGSDNTTGSKFVNKA